MIRVWRLINEFPKTIPLLYCFYSWWLPFALRQQTEACATRSGKYPCMNNNCSMNNYSTVSKSLLHGLCPFFFKCKQTLVVYSLLYEITLSHFMYTFQVLNDIEKLLFLYDITSKVTEVKDGLSDNISHTQRNNCRKQPPSLIYCELKIYYDLNTQALRKSEWNGRR